MTKNLFVEIILGGQRSLFISDMSDLEEKVKAFIKRYSEPDMAKMPFDQKAKAMAMRTAMKAFLAIAGDMMLEMLFGHDRPKIGWDDDALEFYPTQIAAGIIETVAKFRYTLISNNDNDKFGQTEPIKISAIHTVTVSDDDQALPEFVGAGTGE